VCNFASFWARFGALLDNEDARDERSRKSVTRNEVAGEEEKRPHPKGCGQRDGTASRIALSEAYSPEVDVSFDPHLVMTTTAHPET
jgi:hypothetical protein